MIALSRKSRLLLCLSPKGGGRGGGPKKKEE